MNVKRWWIFLNTRIDCLQKQNKNEKEINQMEKNIRKLKIKMESTGSANIWIKSLS